MFFSEERPKLSIFSHEMNGWGCAPLIIFIVPGQSTVGQEHYELTYDCMHLLSTSIRLTHQRSFIQLGDNLMPTSTVAT